MVQAKFEEKTVVGEQSTDNDLQEKNVICYFFNGKLSLKNEFGPQAGQITFLQRAQELYRDNEWKNRGNEAVKAVLGI